MGKTMREEKPADETVASKMLLLLQLHIRHESGKWGMTLNIPRTSVSYEHPVLGRKGCRIDQLAVVRAYDAAIFTYCH
jgi:hypothetical protein